MSGKLTWPRKTIMIASDGEDSGVLHAEQYKINSRCEKKNRNPNNNE